jgi:predicted Rossmann-fold nucleotide-binding protein
MGEVARTLVSLSGPDSVHGIIPRSLLSLESHQPTTPQDPSAEHSIDATLYGRTTIVQDMHTRKRLMASEVISGGPGGGFVALSGGYGTFEELMEVTTWNQLGIHSGFISPGNAGILSEATSADEVVKCLGEYVNAPGRFNLSWEEQ